jgi:ribonuclease D
MWQPAGTDLEAIAGQLRALGARPWQVELTAPMLHDAAVSAQPVD